MSTKTKNKQPALTDVAQQVGVVLMSAAATLGLLDLPNHPNSKIVLPNQPVFSFVNETEDQQFNPLRREREETAPHYVSYSVTQRTPARSGKK